MTISGEQIDVIIEYLENDNCSLSDAVEAIVGDFHSEDILTSTQKQDIFSRIFECSSCGYWSTQDIDSNDHEGKKCEECVSIDLGDEQEE